VAYLATELGGRLDLDPPALGRLRLAATFHDIGKIGISDALLRKPGPLDEAERKAMQEHPGLGEGLLKPMRTMQGILHLVRHHHERLDGSGYPDGLCGDALSLELRVLSVVDIYQALVMQRSYKPAFSPAKALGILREEARKGWWDPGVVESLASLLESVPHR
jgi:putative two-component system response regulator